MHKDIFIDPILKESYKTMPFFSTGVDKTPCQY